MQRLSYILYKKKLNKKVLNLKFFPTNDLMNTKYFNNISKVRCIAINKDGLVCMISNNGLFNWIVPGGTIEKDENPIITLKRELIEEADIQIKNYELIGFLEVKLVNLYTKSEKKYTEMWFYSEISKVLPQTEDPAKGFILYRDFFHIEDSLFKFQKWGKISKYFFDYTNNKIKKLLTKDNKISYNS